MLYVRFDTVGVHGFFVHKRYSLHYTPRAATLLECVCQGCRQALSWRYRQPSILPLCRVLRLVRPTPCPLPHMLAALVGQFGAHLRQHLR
jgi:hypothetical protein